MLIVLFFYWQMRHCVANVFFNLNWDKSLDITLNSVLGLLSLAQIVAVQCNSLLAIETSLFVDETTLYFWREIELKVGRLASSG